MNIKQMQLIMEMFFIGLVIIYMLVIGVILQVQIFGIVSELGDAQRHFKAIDDTIPDMTTLKDVRAFKLEIESYVSKELEGYRLNMEQDKEFREWLWRR